MKLAWVFFFFFSKTRKRLTQEKSTRTTYNYQSPKIVVFITHFWWTSCLGHKRLTNADKHDWSNKAPNLITYKESPHCDFWLIESYIYCPKHQNGLMDGLGTPNMPQTMKRLRSVCLTW